MNFRPYSDIELCQDDVSGQAMQRIVFGNSPLDAGTIIEYGIVTSSMMDADNDFPTGKLL